MAVNCFGMKVCAGFPVPGLEGVEGVEATDPAETPLTPTISLKLVDSLALSNEDVSASNAGRVLLDAADGYERLRVRRDSHGSMLVSLSNCGRFLVDDAGSTIHCAPDRRDDWRWQRFLVAQVLPLAALRHGFEVFHASVVAVEGRAIAIVGTSQAGKTSVAVDLILRAHGFLADDVLAVRRRDGALMAQPGPALVNLRRKEAERVGADRLRRLGGVSRSDRQLLRVTVSREPLELPLGAMYYLDHSADGGGVVVEEKTPPDPRLIFASTFNVFDDSVERLKEQLDVCASIAKRVAVNIVRVPAGRGVAEVADAIEAHAYARSV